MVSAAPRHDRTEGAANVHATALLVGDRGILVTGPSGAGKTTLALALVGHFCARGRLARLIGDDQLLVEARGGRLLCRAPAAIAGLAEVPGIGPRPVQAEPAAVVDLVLRLVAEGAAARMQDPATETIAGCALPRFDLPRRNVAAALPLVAAQLGLPPFA
jgi:serine kinase of HPr protein (carbohydrate metabolism regulator)